MPKTETQTQKHTRKNMLEQQQHHRTAHSDQYTVVIHSEFDSTTHTIHYDHPHITSDHIIRDFLTRRQHAAAHDDEEEEHDAGEEYYVTCRAKVLRSGLFLDTDYSVSIRCNTPLFVQLHMSGALRGGKGGFGAQLRSQGTKVGQKKTTNFSGCRDLHGRRLRDVRDERRVRQWLVEEEQREREETERRGRERRERYTSQRETVMTEHGETIKKQTELVQNAVASGLMQQQKKNKKRKLEEKVGEETSEEVGVTHVRASSGSSGSSSSGNHSNGSDRALSSEEEERMTSNAKNSTIGKAKSKKKKKQVKKKRKTSALFASSFDDDDSDTDSDNAL